VQPGARIAALKELVLNFDRRATERVRWRVGHTGTVFARDPALAARGAHGQPMMILPRPFGPSTRSADNLNPDKVTRLFELDTFCSSLFWEGGNIVHDSERLFVGADSIAQNMFRLGLTQSQVRALFCAEFGSEVVVLGDPRKVQFDIATRNVTRSGQAAYHIDLDVALLGKFGRKRKPRALLADVALGLDYLPALLRQRRRFVGHFLPPPQMREFIAAEYEAYAHERHPQLLGYCTTLENLGYHVIGLPDLRIDPEQNVFRMAGNLDFLYCNAVVGRNRGRPAVHYLEFGLRALDHAVASRLRRAGLEPVRVNATTATANALMDLNGGLRCFCGRLPSSKQDLP